MKALHHNLFNSVLRYRLQQQNECKKKLDKDQWRFKGKFRKFNDTFFCIDFKSNICKEFSMTITQIYAIDDVMFRYKTKEFLSTNESLSTFGCYCDKWWPQPFVQYIRTGSERKKKKCQKFTINFKHFYFYHTMNRHSGGCV